MSDPYIQRTPTKIKSTDDDNAEKFTPRRSLRQRGANRKYWGSVQKSRNQELGECLADESPSIEEKNIELDDDLRCIKSLTNDELHVAGKMVYGFQTPKKRGGMAEMAASCTPKTPKISVTTKSAFAPKTPKTDPRTPTRSKQIKTPDTNRKHLALKTPRHIRNRTKKEISKLLVDSSGTDFSQDESDYEPDLNEMLHEDEIDSDSSSSEDQLESKVDIDKFGSKTAAAAAPTSASMILPKTPSRSRKKAAKNYIPESDGYFESYDSKKIVTSDNTLSDLKPLAADKLSSLLDKMKLSENHENAISNMMAEYEAHFNEWLYLLDAGFSILVNGLGSKRSLLQSFHRNALKGQTVIVVNGFFPSLTIKDILDSIMNDLEISSGPRNPKDVMNIIEDEFALLPDSHLFLIVHNIDGPMLRNSKAQEILCRLAKIPNIHLIASIDHINTPLIWDQRKLSDYNFSWWDCTTMLPYTVETSSENSLMIQNTTGLALSSMRSVFQSLNANAKRIYISIVKHQLKNKGNSDYQGMLFDELYDKSRVEFLTSSGTALRAQLTEFSDHKMIRSKRNVDGAEHLTIPIDSVLLKHFLEEQEN